MNETELIPHLFRTEYRKIVSVLIKLFGIDHIEIAEDIVSDSFLLASELWSLKGLPDNPTAWLYTVAKNKTKDYLKRHALFAGTISKELRNSAARSGEIDIDLSAKNIQNSELAMIFVVCHPCNPPEAQIGLALNILCGFSVDEIARSFLTDKEVIYKRLQRARKKLRTENIKIEQPGVSEIKERLPAVLMTLYLFYNEGYYSAGPDMAIRKDLCFEAMRLTALLLERKDTNEPAINALLALMCFQSSRLDARVDADGQTILYENQDDSLWDQGLIRKGEGLLSDASQGDQLTKYHIEAYIAYWHTQKADSPEKWEGVLQLYNQLLLIEYSPVAALNRTYALAKANSKQEAIIEAEKINLSGNHLYHALLGELYSNIDNSKALTHWKKALQLAKSATDKTQIANKIRGLQENYTNQLGRN